MNDTPKENTAPSSMTSAVNGGSELHCVEPIFSAQVNGAEIKLGLVGVQVTTISIRTLAADAESKT